MTVKQTFKLTVIASLLIAVIGAPQSAINGGNPPNSANPGNGGSAPIHQQQPASNQQQQGTSPGNPNNNNDWNPVNSVSTGKFPLNTNFWTANGNGWPPQGNGGSFFSGNDIPSRFQMGSNPPNQFMFRQDAGTPSMGNGGFSGNWYPPPNNNNGYYYNGAGWNGMQWYRPGNMNSNPSFPTGNINPNPSFPTGNMNPNPSFLASWGNRPSDWFGANSGGRGVGTGGGNGFNW